MKIFNLLSMMLLIVHWSGCLQFLVPMLQGKKKYYNIPRLFITDALVTLRLSPGLLGDHRGAAGGGLVGAILLVPLQGDVSHALYRLRPVPPSEHDGPLAHHGLHDRRCHMFRPHPWSRHLDHPEPGQQQAAVQGEGEHQCSAL